MDKDIGLCINSQLQTEEILKSLIIIIKYKLAINYNSRLILACSAKLIMRKWTEKHLNTNFKNHFNERRDCC